VNDRQMTQWAPYPVELEAAVSEWRYRPGWGPFWLSDEGRDYAPDDHERKHPIAGGLTFNFHVPGPNTYDVEDPRPTHHTHIVPAATYNRQAWEEWIFQCCLLSDQHESSEWARFESEPGDPIHDCSCDAPIRHSDEHASDCKSLGTTRRPFAPTHGPGDNPYILRFSATDLQRRMSFRGILNDS
jgi:hypothetical protein